MVDLHIVICLKYFTTGNNCIQKVRQIRINQVQGNLEYSSFSQFITEKVNSINFL